MEEESEFLKPVKMNMGYDESSYFRVYTGHTLNSQDFDVHVGSLTQIRTICTYRVWDPIQ